MDRCCSLYLHCLSITGLLSDFFQAPYRTPVCWMFAVFFFFADTTKHFAHLTAGSKKALSHFRKLKNLPKKLFSKKILCLLCSETSFIFPPCWTSYLSLRSGFADRCLKPLLKLAEFAFSSHGYLLACSVISVSQHFWSHQKMEIHLPESIINLPDFSCPSDCLKPVSL